MLYPATSADVLAIQERLTKGSVPVPVKAERAGESAALLTNESVADGSPLSFGVKATLRDTSFPAETVNGNGTSSTENCKLLLEIEEIVTLPPPALSSNVRVSLVPTATLPKLSVAGIIPRCGLLTPKPVNGISSCGPATKEPPPVGPTACGLKVMSNFNFCPAARVKGNVAPLTENPSPCVCKLERVTLDGLVLVNTTGNFELAPITTSPNTTLRGLTVTPSRATPVPSNGTVRIRSVALLTKVSAPPIRPFAVGVNVSVTARLSPAARTRSSVACEALTSVWFVVTLEIVTFDCPRLVATTRRVCVRPTTT